MPIALETSKRKFHQLLDNLTKPPSTTSRSDGIQMLNQPAAKRARLEPQTRHARPTSTISLVASKEDEGALTGSAIALQTSKPYYTPWSHDCFLQRLRTFADLTLWASKPDSINEVAWAKRGWTCVGVNAVSCKGGCEKRVVVALRPRRKDENGVEIADSEDYSVDVDNELVDRYVAILETGHDDECLWRLAGCKDDIYRLPIARPSTWQTQLRERYLSFGASGSHIPSASRLNPRLALEAISNQLPKSILAPGTITDPSSSTSSLSIPPATTLATHNPTALTFALLGWSCVTTDPSYPIATCGACFRRLGLWLYTTPAAKSITGDDPNAQEETDHMPLDLVANHREYCPWINPRSQSMPGTFAGLSAREILLKLIRNNAVDTPQPPTQMQMQSQAQSHTRVRAASDTSTAAASTRVDDTGDTAASSEREQRLLDGAADGAVTATANTNTDFDSNTSATRQATVAKEDKARFARLKELTRSMGLGLKGRGLKGKLGRGVGKSEKKS